MALSVVGFSGIVSAQKSITVDTLHLHEVEVFGKVTTVFPIQEIPSKSFEINPVRDIGDFLRTEPNVSGIKKGGVGIDPVVRGFKYNQVSVVLNNGVKIEGGCPNRMDPVAAHVESENINKLSILKGPYILKYGPVLGALINIETVLPQPYSTPTIHGEFLYGFETNWNGQREHLSLAGGNDKVFFTANGGFKGYGSYTAGNEKLYNTSFQKLYGGAGVGFALHKNHQIIVNYAYDQGKNILFPALPMDERLDQTHVASMNYQYHKASGSLQSLEFQAYYSPVHHVMDNLNRASSKTMQAVTTVDAWTAGGKTTGTVLLGKQKLLVGADFDHVFKDGEKKMTMRMIMEGDTFISNKYQNVWLQSQINNIGAYAEYKIPLGETELVAALRLDYNQAFSNDTFRLVKEGVAYFDALQSTFFNVSFGLGLKKQLNSWLSLSTSIGKGSRSPSVLERFIKLMPVQYDSYDYLGNPQLKPENNYQADLSFEFMKQGLGALKIGGFFSLVTDYVTGKVLPPSVIKPTTQGAPGVKQFVNIDNVYLTGFEVSFQSPTTSKWEVSGNVAATYSTIPQTTKYVVSGGQVVDEVEVMNDPLPEIPPLEGRLTIAYKFLHGKLIPGISGRFAAAQNRVSEAYGEFQTPGFVTGAASLRYYPFRFATLVAGVENVMNTPYYEHLNRRMVGTTERFYEPGRVFYVTLIVKF